VEWVAPCGTQPGRTSSWATHRRCRPHGSRYH